MSVADHEFFFREVVRHARTMPLSDARRFLSGCLLTCDDAPEVAPIRAAYTHLFDCDRQLELLAVGQLPLGFPASVTVTRAPHHSESSPFAGANLRAAREERGWTLEELGALVEYTPGHLSNIENGGDKPGRRLIRKLAAVFANPPSSL